MGKETGFLELDREDRSYADPRERVKHYKEFVIPPAEDHLRKQASRCMNCGIPYCHNGCPVNNQIPDWNHLVYESDWREALDNWDATLTKFVKVMPRDYARALQQLEAERDEAASVAAE